MEEILEYLMVNKEWLFSGLALSIVAGVGWILKRAFFSSSSGKISQSQKSGDNSTNVQIGGDADLSSND